MENVLVRAAKAAIKEIKKKELPKLDVASLNYATPTAYFRVPGAGGYGTGIGLYYNRWSLQVYDGEKTLGNAGPITERIPDQQALRVRGWEAYLTNETVQAIVNKCVKWIIGRGLKLQCVINTDVLKSEGINLTNEEAQKLSDLIEARFGIYANSTMSSYSGMKCLNIDESAAFRNVYNGGDVLVVLRYTKGQVKYQLIDGQHVRSPQGGTDFNPQLCENGNRIMNGVEMDESGTHIAYHIQDATMNWRRIMCKNKTTGLTVAYLVGGLEYRLDYSRTFPLFSGLFEIVKTLERYSDATLTSAEEQNKNAYQVVSEVTASGGNPMDRQVASAMDLKGNTGTIPVDSQYVQMADKVAATTNKQLIHNFPGGKIEPINKNEAELYFKDFRGEFFEMICSAVNAPPNVIRSKYDTSFSSARASIKDWEHTLLVDRYKFSWQFRRPIYEFWLHMEVLKMKVNLPEYLQNHAKGNEMVMAAYRNATWLGDNVPHIDPVKEVMAERLKLGSLFDTVPLTTLESATQNTNGGDSRHNVQQGSRELQEGNTAGFKEPEPTVVAPGGDPKKGKKAQASYSDVFNLASTYVTD